MRMVKMVCGIMTMPTTREPRPMTASVERDIALKVRHADNV